MIAMVVFVVTVAAAGVIGVLVGMPIGEARQRRRLTAALNEMRDKRERQPFDPPSELAMAELTRALRSDAGYMRLGDLLGCCAIGVVGWSVVLVAVVAALR